MSADRLLRHYERIADAPDAPERLRRLVLDLAVRGKIVPQDSSDEPASELLRHIASEKARLARAEEIKKGKELPPVEGDAIFGVPPNWDWTRLGTVTSYIQRGRSPDYAATDGSLVVSQKCVQWRGLDLSVAKRITLKSLADYEDVRFLRTGDLLWNSTGTGTIGRVIRLVDPPRNLVCDSHVTVVRCLGVDPEYIRIWLRSDHVYGQIEERAAGSTNQVELTAQMAVQQLVPLPPLAEQHRIVETVDQLMALCDSLAAARKQREIARDRVTVVCLASLNEPDPSSFRDGAGFAVNNFGTFTARANQIPLVRQRILDLAVRGRLVRQDSRDEPASELLRRVAEERAKRGRVERIKSDATEEQRPDAPPSGWVWAPLSDLVTVLNGRAYAKNELLDAGRTPVLRVGNLFTSSHWYHSDLELDNDKYCDAGDLLFAWSASFGPFIWPGPKVIYHYHIWKLALHSTRDLDRNYVYRFLLRQTQEIKDAGHGISMTHMTKAKMERVLVPVPPLAEQQRIVAKIDELMGVCDQLEQQLTEGTALRSRLFAALVSEATTAA